MAAGTTRQEARARLQAVFQTALERLIPSTETVPLRGRTFADFEHQAYACGHEVLAAMLEERAQLDDRAVESTAGRCPHCESDRTYLAKETQAQALYSPSGGVNVTLQQARCRACGGAFSPSAAGVGVAGGSAADAAGRAARRAGSRRAIVRQGRASAE
jgi:hypothetical protein